MKTSYTSAFKAKVVLELLKEDKTLAQLAAEHHVHPNVLREWKVVALRSLPSLFERRDSVAALEQSYEQQLQDLYAQIGRLTTQLAWIKKTNPVAGDIPPGEKRCRLPRAARASIIGCCIPKTRPRSLLVCGRLTSDQSP